MHDHRCGIDNCTDPDPMHPSYSATHKTQYICIFKLDVRVSVDGN